jgi:putative two-component system response regulator
VFDALTHERPYKAAWPVGDAVNEILDQRARQFDPEVIDAFALLEHESLLGSPSDAAVGNEATPPGLMYVTTP